MVSYREAIYLINKNIIRKEEKIKTVDSLNRICFSNAYSNIDYPFFNNSAVDGYLLYIDNISFDLKLKLYFIDLSSEIIFSGNFLPNTKVLNNFTYEICTGAIIPSEFNCVLAKENVYIYKKKIFFSNFPKINENIRFMGEDFKKNTLLLSAFEKINPLKIALLLTGGVSEVIVFFVPKILLLSTGDELIYNNDKCNSDKVFNSNIFMIYNEIKKNFILKVDCFFSRDNYENIMNILSNFSIYNLIVVIGGMSFGKHDFTRDAFNKLGVKEIFFLGNWKPGKPLYFGSSNGIFFFGLPGNPTSCYITFKVFVEYLIKNLIGDYLNFFFLKDFFSINYIKKNNSLFFLHGTFFNNILFINEKQNSNLINSISNSNIIIFLDDFYENEIKNNLITYIYI